MRDHTSNDPTTPIKTVFGSDVPSKYPLLASKTDTKVEDLAETIFKLEHKIGNFSFSGREIP